MNFRWRVSHSSRLIDFLKEQLDCSFSGRFLKKSLESNVCRINGRIERFASAALCKGDIVELQAAWEKTTSKGSVNYTVLFEDDHLFVIDKPAGMVCSDDEFKKVLPKPYWLAHRLDKDTTGVLLFGKTPPIAKELQVLFEKREVKKKYLAFVDGIIRQKEGVIENRLVKKSSFQGQTIWGASSSGRGLYAKTVWYHIASRQNISLLLCQPETGRTHQLRSHLAQIGHPILVDRQYAATFRSSFFASRPLLHAYSLDLKWRHQMLHFEAALPKDFQEALVNLHFEDEFRSKISSVASYENE